MHAPVANIQFINTAFASFCKLPDAKVLVVVFSEETDSSSSGSSEREETDSDISDSMTSTDESEEDPGKDNLAYAKTLLILGLSLGS